MGEKDALASPNGVDGKYRRTAASPPPPPPPEKSSAFSTPPGREGLQIPGKQLEIPGSHDGGVGHAAAAHSRQGSNCSSNGSKTPAKTPKRESPATIAAKGKLREG